MFTIIIATKNNADNLDRCLTHLATITVPKQVIVKDAKSTDHTDEIITKNAAVVSKFISLSDKGIYDAWNQALPYAAGEYICFSGADDLIDRGWIAAALSYASEVQVKPALIYGNLIRRLGDRERLYAPPEMTEIYPTDLRRFWIPHPGLLHHRSLFDGRTFRQDLQLAGDYHFILRAVLLAGRVTCKKIVGTQCIMGADGLSHSMKGVDLSELDFEKIETELGFRPAPPRIRVQFLRLVSSWCPVCALRLRRLSWWLLGERKLRS
ncbi:MAG: glycosyltransferase [Betaproteobacteria bacterium]|nr:glycosyltransferase [Betaproteobacteria bacterium]